MVNEIYDGGDIKKKVEEIQLSLIEQKLIFAMTKKIDFFFVLDNSDPFDQLLISNCQIFNS